MAGGRHNFDKRRRELERQRKRKAKAERRAQRKLDKPDRGEDDVDPDIAGIVPGPQAQPWMDVPARGEAAILLAEDEKNDDDDDDDSSD